MREFIIGSNDAGQRMDRFLSKACPSLPASLAQKFLRRKRCKVNGRAAARDTRLAAGDVVQLYLNDEFFDQPSADNAYLSVTAPRLDILYVTSTSCW